MTFELIKMTPEQWEAARVRCKKTVFDYQAKLLARVTESYNFDKMAYPLKLAPWWLQ